jgi:hypothetical protein
MYFMLQSHIFLLTITKNNDILKLKSLFKHIDLISEFCFDRNF